MEEFIQEKFKRCLIESEIYRQDKTTKLNRILASTVSLAVLKICRSIQILF
jgi:hypothetical protein